MNRIKILRFLIAFGLMFYPALSNGQTGSSQQPGLINNSQVSEPDFSMIGYATVARDGVETTTGGKNGEVIVIETLEQLIAWGAKREDNYNAETVIIKGKIEANPSVLITIKRGKDISILGDSESNGGFAELKNISLNIRDYSNVIVRNLKIHEVFYPNDCLTIDHCHHVWIDHCEFHSKIGPGIGVDTYDGLLDIKKGSHNVTVSWCYFHDHMKTILIGHSDNNGEQDKNLQVTFHHNWFSNTDGRNPSLRFGLVHYFNNYLENISDYGFAVRNGAHAKIENCHFESVNTPIATDKFKGHGYACVSGCIYTGSCTEADNQVSDPVDCEFWDNQIPYSYQLEDVQTVKSSVQEYAGVGKVKLTTSGKQFIQNNDFEVENYTFSEAEGAIRICINGSKNQEIQISVYSITGEKIYSGKAEVIQGNQQIKIPLQKNLKGICILAITSPSKKETFKLFGN
ncbi:hypothetical protein [Mariniphaga sp.]|uniref:pectate lyase family protein n=1 Tax=Mariniphaga sp. TaxID=1954475 RepID=UPI0035665E2E